MILKDVFKKEKLGFLIIVGTIFILISFLLIYSELKGAKSFCNSIEGKYKLEFKGINFNHLCNQESIFQYSSDWDFNRNIDMGIDLLNISS